MKTKRPFRFYHRSKALRDLFRRESICNAGQAALLSFAKPNSERDHSVFHHKYAHLREYELLNREPFDENRLHCRQENDPMQVSLNPRGSDRWVFKIFEQSIQHCWIRVIWYIGELPTRKQAIDTSMKTNWNFYKYNCRGRNDS